jgi:hypothetical protein
MVEGQLVRRAGQSLGPVIRDVKALDTTPG